jgi:hypothetical protein
MHKTKDRKQKIFFMINRILIMLFLGDKQYCICGYYAIGRCKYELFHQFLRTEKRCKYYNFPVGGFREHP